MFMIEYGLVTMILTITLLCIWLQGIDAYPLGQNIKFRCQNSVGYFPWQKCRWVRLKVAWSCVEEARQTQVHRYCVMQWSIKDIKKIQENF